MVLKQTNGNKENGKTSGENGNRRIHACGKTKKMINEEFARMIGNQPRFEALDGKPVYGPGETDCHGFPLPMNGKKNSTEQATWLAKKVSIEGMARD